MGFCNEHGTSDYCTECMTEPLEKQIATLQAENKKLREAAQAVVDSKRGMGHLVPSSVGWEIDLLGAALENSNE